MTKRERFKLSVSVFLILKNENKILLLKRSNAGWMDGFYSLPAGALEEGETILEAIIRESKEEVDIEVLGENLKLVHTIHCFTNNEEWMGQFFLAEKWNGEPRINEPEKHSEIKWIEIDNLPKNIIPYVSQAINNYLNKISYSSYTG